MSFDELLAKVLAEHKIVQSKYDEALIEIASLRTRIAASQGPGLDCKLPREDREAAAHQQHWLVESYHTAPPPEVPEETDEPEVVDEAEDRKERGTRRVTLTVGKVQSISQSFSVQRAKTALKRSSRAQVLIAQVLQNQIVELLLMLTVIANIVLMWLATDERAAKLPRTAWYEVANLIFLAIYICEFALRAFVYRSHVFEDRWVRFDFIVIAVDLLLLVFKGILGDKMLGGFDASVFRLFRGLRLVRIFKNLHFPIELQLLIHGFFASIKAVSFAMVMLEGMVVLWCFIFVETIHPIVLEMSSSGTFNECSRCSSFYKLMWHAHLTIWQQVIAGDSWGLVSLDVLEAYPQTAFVFYGCLMTLQFCVLNLIFTAVIHAASKASEDDKHQRVMDKERAFSIMKAKILSLCSHLDSDGSGELSFDELMDGYEQNAEFAQTMASMDVTIEDMSIVFMVMDEDRSGSVSYTEFVNNIWKMKEQDTRTLLIFIKGYVVDLRYKIKEDVTQLLQDILSSEHKIEDMMHRVRRIEGLSKYSTVEAREGASIHSIMQDGLENTMRTSQGCKGSPTGALQESVKEDNASAFPVADATDPLRHSGHMCDVQLDEFFSSQTWDMHLVGK